MGAAMYLDLRTLHKISRPVSNTDLEEIRRIRWVVTSTFVLIWASGLSLVWYRTEIAIEAFSPKLWSKLFVVSVLTLNAIMLAAFVIPNLRRFEGIALLDMPFRILLPMAMVAGVSGSSWILALMLGFSKFLKTAHWDVLVPFLSFGFAAGIGGVILVVFALRSRHRSLA
jgi:hypothetical protein